MTATEVDDSGLEGLPVGLAALAAGVGEAAKPRPVERWNPPDCGDIDIRIAADGTWHYRGTPISREPLVRLFASVLRREPDGRHVLVTPVEKLGIVVEDAPFLAVAAERNGEGDKQQLFFRTNMGDVVTAGPEHPLRFQIEPGTGGLRPYVRVRGGLEALLTRALAQDLVALTEQHEGQIGVWSAENFFAFPEAALG